MRQQRDASWGPAPLVAFLLGLMPAVATAADGAPVEDSSALFGPPAPAPAAPPAPASAPVAENSADLFGPAAAVEQVAPASAAEPPAGFTLKPRAWHEFGYHQPVYGDALDYSTEMKAPAFRNVLGVEARYGTVKLVSDWQLDLLLDRTGPTADDVQPRLRPLENYLSWSPAGAGLRVSAGYQIFAWGAADQLNPTDNLNPRDYTLGLVNTPKVPILALDVTWYPVDALSVEAVYAPVDQQDRFPADFAAQTRAVVGAATPATYRDLKLSPDSFVAGGRVAYRGKVDASLSYLYDHDTYYTASVSGRLYPVPDATITLVRPRLHRVGADLKGTLGSFGLWAEAAASFTEHSSDTVVQRHWWLDYVVGVDSLFGPADKAYFNLQYIGSVVPDFDSGAFDKAQASNPFYGEAFYRRALASSLGFQTAKAWQGASLDLKVELLDGLLKPELRAVYLVPVGYDDSSVKHHGSLALNPELDITPVDSFHIRIGADLAWSWVSYKGSSDLHVDTTSDRIGEYTQSNNVYVKLAYQWDLEAKK